MMLNILVQVYASLPYVCIKQICTYIQILTKNYSLFTYFKLKYKNILIFISKSTFRLKCFVYKSIMYKNLSLIINNYAHILKKYDFV